jgi:hypothetical protein
MRVAPGFVADLSQRPITQISKARPDMATTHQVNREWISNQFSRGIEAESRMEADAKATSASPPDPSLGVLYHEIAEADGRHRRIVETIATRYGYNPSRGLTGGIGGSIKHLREKVGELGSSPQQRIEHDLSAKASAIHWCTAWVHAFQTIGDAESARELTAVMTEEKAHHDALQEGLNRFVARAALGEG